MAATGPFVAESDLPKVKLARDSNGFSKRFNDALAGLPSTEHHLHPREKGKAPAFPDAISTSAFAVVDFTDGIPKYGANAQEFAEKHIFSLAKIVPMFVAFRLQERLRNQFRADPASSAKELVAKVQAAWKAEVQKKGLFANGYRDFPKLERIFDLNNAGKGGNWTFNFQGSQLSWEKLQQLHETCPKSGAQDFTIDYDGHPQKFHEDCPSDYNSTIPKPVVDHMSFKDRMKLMIRMSDNMATGAIAHDIGLSYILGTLRAEGFYSDANRGLWLSNTYGYDNVPDTSLGGYESKGDNITAGGNANAIATFFTLLWQKQLVSSEASEGMLSLLKVRGVGYGSWYSKGLPEGAVTYSKVGLGDWSSEAAIIEYVAKKNPIPVTGEQGTYGRIMQEAINRAYQNVPVHIRYVAIALEVNGVQLADVIRRIDPFIRTEHGVNLFVPS
jgi:hypothetical protein